MKTLPQIFEANRKWSQTIQKERPGFFEKLSKQQAPKYLWIGCADSRVPANQICGLEPGEVFVHRNVANLVVHTDINCLSVIQYAVEALKVTDVIVCGHYGCGGVKAAYEGQSLGLIDYWLRNIKDVYAQHVKDVDDLKGGDEKKVDRLCELNVIHQVKNLCHTSIVQEAWKRRQALNVHGWIYGLADGLLKDLEVCVSSVDQVDRVFRLK